VNVNFVIPEPLVNALHNSHAVVVLTGAGVSAESGIPTFRDAMEGLWAKYDPSQLATPEAFARDPETVTRWYDWRREKCAAAKPNPAHLALARLQQAVEKQHRRFTLITQNVDRLHQAAGSRDVIELHGTLWVWRCIRCGAEREEREAPFKEFPPKCTCGGNRRPAIVWFGEALPEDVLKKSYTALESCDLFFPSAPVPSSNRQQVSFTPHAGMARRLWKSTKTRRPPRASPIGQSSPAPAKCYPRWCGEVSDDDAPSGRDH
jgi:NAD-dependent deacetylase